MLQAEDQPTLYYSHENRSGNFLSEDVSGNEPSIDLTPKGREEYGPTFSLGGWARHHDGYDASGFVDPTGGCRESTVRDLN